jgi:hypothetical protein
MAPAGFIEVRWEFMNGFALWGHKQLCHAFIFFMIRRDERKFIYLLALKTALDSKMRGKQ